MDFVKYLAYFWLIKLLTTAMGEATSDYPVYQVNPYLAVALGAIGFAAAFILQYAGTQHGYTGFSWSWLPFLAPWSPTQLTVLFALPGLCCRLFGLNEVFGYLTMTQKDIQQREPAGKTAAK